ncbi:MAG: ATP-grasp domain-containing protein [Myxococcales bacterium]|nr:ATP-grasp domain-containing protein [Myxococcales bacterium]
MRNVVFVAPFPMDVTMRFCRGIGQLDDVRVLGVFQQAPSRQQAGWMHDVATVGDALDPEQIAGGLALLAARNGPLHRITGILESLQVPLAQVRAHFGVAGPSVETARRFRDKALMKETLRAAGIPCARHSLLTCLDDAKEFVARVGFPIVLKPPAGAGARSTWRIDGAPDLHAALADIRPSARDPVLAEEFLRGAEHSCELVVTGGQVRALSVSHYLPGPLEVLRTPWIQWCCVLPRDVAGPEYADLRVLAPKVVRVLGLEDGIAHMEWFRRDDGSLAVGEIAARPPGGQLALMTGLVHDADIYRAWARAAVDGAFDGPWTRRYAAGAAFLRGQGRGRVAEVTGVAAAHRAVGHLVAEARLPQPGAPKSDSYEGDGYVVVRHPDTDVVLRALRLLVQTIRIQYA